ncbi:MAG: radical SAM protein [Symbiobacteriaceae bacterium]|nr:radical SAM protein [Symbiobacteriaceae bacterium]
MSLSCAIYTLGCKVNSYESSKLAQELQQAGFNLVPWEEPADIYIIHGCAVTNQAEVKTRQVARGVKREHPESFLLLLGCIVDADPEIGSKVQAELQIANAHKEEAVSLLIANLSGLGERLTPPASPCDNLPAATPSRPLVKIQDGCNNHCSYCLIPRLRGRERSRSLEEIMTEVIWCRDKGYQELVLTGIHLARWGQDWSTQHELPPHALVRGDPGSCRHGLFPLTGTTFQSHSSQASTLIDGGYPPPNPRRISGACPEMLTEAPLLRHGSRGGVEAQFTPSPGEHSSQASTLPDLLAALLALPNLPRLRLSSVELPEVSLRLIELMAHNSQLCAHLHLPLQSGCDATLRRMERRYDTESYREKVALLRHYLPGLALTTDIIVGFPGEDEKEFQQTMDFCREMAFSRLHVFRYSRRPHTLAATMPQQVARQVAQRRSRDLIELGEEMAAAYAATFVGKKVWAVLEQKREGEPLAEGYSEHYLSCSLPYPYPVPATGLLQQLLVTASRGPKLMCQLLP